MSAPTLAPDSLAIAVGIADREQFSACLRSADASAELMSDRSIAELMGVAALPTFVVDREWVSGVEPARLRELVLRHLR